MAPLGKKNSKKKNKAKKKKKKKNSAVEEAEERWANANKNFDRSEIELLEQRAAKTDWIWVDVCVLNWSYTKFSCHVRTNTPVYYIRRKIEEKHGRITDLVCMHACTQLCVGAWECMVYMHEQLGARECLCA